MVLLLPSGRDIGDNPHINGHIILEILVSGDKSMATVILKTDPFCRTFVEAIEILNGGDN